jgi:hypothetical protein
MVEFGGKRGAHLVMPVNGSGNDANEDDDDNCKPESSESE